MDQRGDHMKMNFEYFQIQKWILQTVRSEKVDEKNGVICLVSMFPSWVMVLKLSKKVHFLQFCADLSKKSKSIKAIYIYASERSRYALSENDIVYYAMTYCFGDISVWSRIILLHFCWVSIFFDISTVNISWEVAQSPIGLFWKGVMRTFRCIYVNCFNRLISCWGRHKIAKNALFLDDLRTITQDGNMQTRQITSFFHPLFPI